VPTFRVRSILVVASMLVAALAAVSGQSAPSPHLVLVAADDAPVITTRSPGAEGIRFGFEGGRAVKVNGVYHLFTSEMAGDPVWVRMRLGHWSSPDRRQWTRVETVRESTGEFEGRDLRAALWSPLPAWDDSEQRWNLFYVAYRSAPGDGTSFMLNHDGRIWRAIARRPGPEGIAGPWDDVGVVMKPGEDSLPWEGLQGTDSFFPYRVGDRWFALYGSAWSQTMPIKHWLVGLASAPTIGGPWRRVPERSPAPIETTFIENPIVTPAPGGGYLAVYDSQGADAIGWTYSADGIDWQPGRRLVVQPKAGQWAKDVRTPLGLVDEGGGRATIFYTGFEQEPDWARLLKGEGRETSAIGYVEVRVERK
jgi:hypothetical protein